MAEIAVEVPARDFRELRALLMGMACGTWISIITWTVVDDLGRTTADRHMSAKERETGVVLTEATNVIEVRFESPAEILERMPGTLAVTVVPSSGPCRVYLPTGMPIAFDPAQKRADWLMRNDANTVAHEFLHCLRGGWHGR